MYYWFFRKSFFVV